MRTRKNEFISFCWALWNPLRRIYWKFFRPKTRGVKIIIADGNNFLFVKNSYGNHGWTFPGGAVGRREDPLRAAVREVAEEVGLNIPPPQFIGTYYNERLYKRDTVYCFFAQRTGGVITPDPQEIASVAWLPFPKRWEEFSRGARATLMVYERFIRSRPSSQPMTAPPPPRLGSPV